MLETSSHLYKKLVTLGNSYLIYVLWFSGLWQVWYIDNQLADHTVS